MAGTIDLFGTTMTIPKYSAMPPRESEEVMEQMKRL
jgi:hypothetical protein